MELWRLTGPERNIYDLIVRRFLAVLLPPSSTRRWPSPWRWRGKPSTPEGRRCSPRLAGGLRPHLCPGGGGRGRGREGAEPPPPWRRGERLTVQSARANPGKTAPPSGTPRPPSSPPWSTRPPRWPTGSRAGFWRRLAVWVPPPPGRTSSRSCFPPSMWAAGKGAGTHLQRRPGGGPGPGGAAQRHPHRSVGAPPGEIAQGREQEGLSWTRCGSLPPGWWPR